MTDPLPCARCHEDATVVKITGLPEWFVRVRRWSKCKGYKPGGGNTCKTPCYPTEAAAVTAWNEMQETVTP